jgi:hypothetical protein
MKLIPTLSLVKRGRVAGAWKAEIACEALA